MNYKISNQKYNIILDNHETLYPEYNNFISELYLSKLTLNINNDLINSDIINVFSGKRIHKLIIDIDMITPNDNINGSICIDKILYDEIECNLINGYDLIHDNVKSIHIHGLLSYKRIIMINNCMKYLELNLNRWKLLKVINVSNVDKIFNIPKDELLSFIHTCIKCDIDIMIDNIIYKKYIKLYKHIHSIDEENKILDL
jgi:hypothetical protein